MHNVNADYPFYCDTTVDLYMQAYGLLSVQNCQILYWNL